MRHGLRAGTVPVTAPVTLVRHLDGADACVWTAGGRIAVRMAPTRGATPVVTSWRLPSVTARSLADRIEGLVVRPDQWPYDARLVVRALGHKPLTLCWQVADEPRALRELRECLERAARLPLVEAMAFCRTAATLARRDGPGAAAALRRALRAFRVAGGDPRRDQTGAPRGEGVDPLLLAAARSLADRIDTHLRAGGLGEAAGSWRSLTRGRAPGPPLFGSGSGR